MFCPRCGAQLSKDSRFCPSCGTKYIRPNKRENLIAISLLSFLLGAAVVAVLLAPRMGKIPRWEAQRTIQIVRQPITIKPGDSLSFPFEINPLMFNGHIGGFFERSGDLRVLVIDEFNFERLQDHQPITSLYDSEKQTPGLIDTNLPSGRFVLVFENGLSSFAPRTVKADIKYSWQITKEPPN